MMYEKKSAITCFYYLIAVDSDIHDIEMDVFESIANEIDPDNYPSYKESIIEDYNKQLESQIDDEDYYDVIVEGVDKVLVSRGYYDGVSPRLLLWNLLVVAFADNDYSKEERRLIKHIVRKSEIEKDVFLEMEELMKANVALDKEIQTLNDSDKPYKEIRPLVEELEERKQVIINSALALIEDEGYVPVAKVEAPNNKIYSGAKNTFNKIGNGVVNTASSIGDGTKKLFGNMFKKEKE